MHWLRHIGIVTVLSAIGFAGTSTNALAVHYDHIDRLALQLQREVEDLHHEVHLHFRFDPLYRHLDADVNQMERLARHIHDVAHHRGSIAHLRHDVEKLDRLFHHVEGLVARMRISCRLDWRTYQHLRISLARISRTLHHLRDDLNPLCPVPLPPVHHHGHGHIHGPVGGHGPGFAISGRRFGVGVGSHGVTVRFGRSAIRIRP